MMPENEFEMEDFEVVEIEEVEVDENALVARDISDTIDWVRNIRASEAVGVKARRIAIVITQLEQAHAYWLSYVVHEEGMGS